MLIKFGINSSDIQPNRAFGRPRSGNEVFVITEVPGGTTGTGIANTPQYIADRYTRAGDNYYRTAVGNDTPIHFTKPGENPWYTPVEVQLANDGNTLKVTNWQV